MENLGINLIAGAFLGAIGSVAVGVGVLRTPHGSKIAVFGFGVMIITVVSGVVSYMVWLVLLSNSDL